jgi:hypothetical protein
MIKKFELLILISAVIFIFARTANAGLTNPGFETGDFNGWSVVISDTGNAQVVTSHDADFSTYSPKEGSYFALLESGSTSQYTTISQSMALSAGDVLSGWAAFDYGDYHDFNDNAYVRIYEGSNLITTPWQEWGNRRPNYSDGPWTKWSFTAPDDATYTAVFGVINYDDYAMDSYGLFDAMKVVPLPGTLFLFCSGLLGIIGIKRSLRA